MSKARPWYKRSGVDFVVSTMNFPSSDHKWAFSAIIDMLNEQDRPLPDNPKYIRGITGLSNQKWSVVRRYLIEHGLLIVIDGEYISNQRFERERAERESDHKRSVENGKMGGLASAHSRQQPLYSNVEDSQKVADNFELIRRLSKKKNRPTEMKRQKLGDCDQPPPQAPSVLQEARIESNLTQPNESVVNELGSVAAGGAGQDGDSRKLEETDLQSLYESVATASGHSPVLPDQIERATRFVRKWRDAGIDFDKVVVPSIRAIISESSEPTRTLGRFDARILHEHARVAATPKSRAYQPPDEPLLAPEGEPETFRPLRDDLLKKLGPIAYSTFLNHVRFEEVDGVLGEDRRVMRVRYVRKGSIILMDGNRVGLVTGAAKAIGFTEVW